MPVDVHIEITGDSEAKAALNALGAQVVPLTRREIYNELLALRNRVTKTGSRPTYPINWDSEKQKRAYFATGGFGHGIPYHRTGRYSRTWRVVRQGEGYALQNPTYYAEYVGGDVEGYGQSRIHQSRWPLWGMLVDEYIDGVPPQAEARIQAEARKLGL